MVRQEFMPVAKKETNPKTKMRSQNQEETWLFFEGHQSRRKTSV